MEVPVKMIICLMGSSMNDVITKFCSVVSGPFVSATYQMKYNHTKDYLIF